MKNKYFLLSIIAIGMVIFLYIDNRKYHSAVTSLQKEHIKLDKIIKEQLEKQFEDTSGFLEKGTPAPSFSLLDEENKMIHQDYSKKKNTLLVFSSSQCSHCEDFYPVLDTFHKTHPDTEVMVLQGLSTPESNKKFLDSTKYGFKMLAAIEDVYINYRIDGTPTCVLLDSQHAIDSTLIVPTLTELSIAVQ